MFHIFLDDGNNYLERNLFRKTESLVEIQTSFVVNLIKIKRFLFGNDYQ